ncbi:hypothetical protein U9M48_016922 [Paspalum notatum var. saurae]|uniref:GYF domain-containing protein n=1 Tax=Paspalum notatum var. saurae TaxID=547442 RepID=A0AAQ3T742_PASNO
MRSSPPSGAPPPFEPPATYSPARSATSPSNKLAARLTTPLQDPRAASARLTPPPSACRLPIQGAAGERMLRRSGDGRRGSSGGFGRSAWRRARDQRLIAQLSGATHQVVDSLNVLDGEPTKGAIEQISDSLNLLHRESSKVAFKQGDATCEATSEAVEACCTGVAPDPALHSQTHDTQDDNPTQATNTDQDETDHSRKAVTPKISDIEVINLDSDEDEDLPTVQHKPDGRVVYAPWAMNGGDLHIERSKLASPAALLAQGAMNKMNLKQCEAAPGTVNGVPPTEQCKPPAAMEQHEPTRAAKNWVSPLAPLWYYVDPQGDTRGPFALMDLLRWKQNGYFDKGFRSPE